MHGSIYPGHLADNSETYTIITNGKRTRNFTDLDEAKDFYEKQDEGAAFIVKAQRTFLRTSRAVKAYREAQAEHSREADSGGTN